MLPINNALKNKVVSASKFIHIKFNQLHIKYQY